MPITNVHIKRNYLRFFALMWIYSLFDSVTDTDVTILLKARGISDFSTGISILTDFKF